MADISEYQSRANTIERGPHLWSAPVPEQAPKVTLYALAAFLIVFGVVIGVAVFNIVRAASSPWREPSMWISVGIPIGMLAFGGYLIYSAIRSKKPEGPRFFFHGVEIGEGSKRKLIQYVELEAFTCAPDELYKGIHTTLLAVTTVVAVATSNAKGVRSTMAELNKEPIFTHLTIKPRDSGELRFPLTRRDYDALAPILPPTILPQT